MSMMDHDYALYTVSKKTVGFHIQINRIAVTIWQK